MFPDWHDDLGIPTVGDDVRIQHDVSIKPLRKNIGFQISVGPKTSSDVLSKQARALGALLASTHDTTARFLDKYTRTVDSTELDGLRVDLKNILENHRSALEYTAHYIAEICVPRPPDSKVYFPVATKNDNADSFAKKLNKWFPHLSESNPEILNYLLSIQEFEGELWLRELTDLTNFNKHRSLSPQELGTFYSVVVKYGDVGVRLGELGFRSITVEEGGVLGFENKLGQKVELDVACLLDVKTTSIAGADLHIEIVKEKHKLYHIPNSKHSIPDTIWSINKNVFQAVNTICSLLSK